MPPADVDRQHSLRNAENNAVALFDEVVRRGLIAPGKLESAVSDAVRDLADEMFGIKKFWHKRIVRAGVNTLEPYRSNPPDRELAEDDIVFLDFGPIFDEWEADFGRTYVLGSDPAKIALRDALNPLWHDCRAAFVADPDITGEVLFKQVQRLTRARGWRFEATMAGHLVGEFPHERIATDKSLAYIAPGNSEPLRRLDPNGEPCHWILELHIVDPTGQFGGFFEQLLDVS